MDRWVSDFDEAFQKIFAPKQVEKRIGICARCHEWAGVEEDEDGDYSECCGATVRLEGEGYDEDYGQER